MQKGLVGLLSFSIGGTILLIVFWDIMANIQIIQGYDPYHVVLQNAIFGFIGFVLVGLGLQLIMKKTIIETKQTSS